MADWIRIKGRSAVGVAFLAMAVGGCHSPFMSSSPSGESAGVDRGIATKVDFDQVVDRVADTSLLGEHYLAEFDRELADPEHAAQALESQAFERGVLGVSDAALDFALSIGVPDAARQGD